MIEIKMTYYPPVNSERGAISFTRQITTKLLANSVGNPIPTMATEAYEILKSNSPELRRELAENEL